MLQLLQLLALHLGVAPPDVVFVPACVAPAVLQTPLMLAAESGDVRTVERLLNAKADPTIKNDKGMVRQNRAISHRRAASGCIARLLRRRFRTQWRSGTL